MRGSWEAGTRPGARLAGVDGFRYLLCFPVALLHALPGDAGQTTATWATLIASACRVAVPFFFIASGYFLRVPPAWSPRIVTRPLGRLLPVYVVWFLIYLAIDALLYGRHGGLTLRGLATGGTAFHLWFIPVLGVALAAVGSGLVVIGARATAALAALLAVIGLLFGAYRDVIGLPAVAGIRMTMAPALVLLGHALARRGVRLRPASAALGVLVALTLVIGEEALIARLAGTTFTSHDIVLATYPLGAFTFLLALGLGRSAPLAALARLGPISLGVYAAHLIFVRLLAGWIGQDGPAGACALAICATLAATALSSSLDQVPGVRRLVR